MTRAGIFTEIEMERSYQQEKYGDAKDDTVMKPSDWIADIVQYATKWRPWHYAPYTTEQLGLYRKCLVKVAALAIAAIESLDRQRVNNPDGKAFFETDPPPSTTTLEQAVAGVSVPEGYGADNGVMNNANMRGSHLG